MNLLNSSEENAVLDQILVSVLRAAHIGTREQDVRFRSLRRLDARPLEIVRELAHVLIHPVQLRLRHGERVHTPREDPTRKRA